MYAIRSYYARAVHTQINVLVKILLVIIAVVAASTMLMSFEKIRQVGVSLLASAGLFGIIAGFAAQKSRITSYNVCYTKLLR